MTSPEEERAQGPEEELLRVMLDRATPAGSNPRRIQEIGQRVTAYRRCRRIRLVSAAVVVAAVGVGVRAWPSSPPERTTAAPPASWAPPGFTDIPQAGLSREPSRGWQVVLPAGARSKDRAVVSFSAVSRSPLTPLSAGAVLVFYVRSDDTDTNVTVRQVSPVDDWCERAGGNRQLVAVRPRADDGGETQDGYACLNDASRAVIDQVGEILTRRSANAVGASGN
ncbi:hypothetical protein ABZT04_38315 [Streptomyces sp. NPDC005492]|uniref:hypothetical protein n=1 Tax=Streptomyces sp. NPDC005492 TaxID=3156883 RepID=UPI0033B7676D